MAQIARVSQTNWLSLEHIVSVQDFEGTLTVICDTGVQGEPLTIYLKGEERLNLLACLAMTATYHNAKKT